MTYQPGDIVVIEKHFITEAIGRMAEIIQISPAGTAPLIERLIAPVTLFYPLLAMLPAGVTWYSLIDSAGEQRAAPHPWLRPLPPLWTPHDAERHAERSIL